MNREDWFKILVEEFRNAYKDLSDNEKKCISNLDDLTEPCQILSITFDFPSLTKTFILHLPNVDDGTVWEYGPIKPYEAFELFERIIDDQIWNTPINKSENIVFAETDEPIFKNLLDVGLMNILKEIQQYIFKPPSISYGTPTQKNIFLNKSAIWTFYGDITKSDPVNIAAQIIQQANNVYEIEQKRQKEEALVKNETQKITQEPSEPAYKWHGTFLFPPVSIEKAPRVSFSERLLGGIHIFQLGTPVYEDKFIERDFIATHNGFVGIKEAEKEIALKMLNCLAAALFLRGTQSYVIRDHELGNFQYYMDSKQFGGWSMPVTPRFSILGEQRQQIPAFEMKAKLSIDELCQALKDAELYLKNEQLYFYILLLLESNTHFAESEYTQSFYMSWVVIEKYLNSKWKATLKEKSIPEKRFERLTNPYSMWSIDYIIEAMDLQNVSALNYDTLMELKKKRNDILHGTAKAKKEDAKKAHSLALDIFFKTKDC
jgi:hypothetical protein